MYAVPFSSDFDDACSEKSVHEKHEKHEQDNLIKPFVPFVFFVDRLFNGR